jgi:hypothetical protein
MSRKQKKSQKKIINELKKQLMIQAERLGIRDDYGPLSMEELKIESVGKIMSDLYMEKSNLEYELNIIGSNKKEIQIKLERLNRYIRKAVSVHERHHGKFEELIEKGMGDLEKTRRALRTVKEPVRVQAAA